MRTVQMTLDDNLVETVDCLAKRLHTTRSAFTRQALRDAIALRGISKLEEKHCAGYIRHPPVHDEFSSWTAEQAWGES